MNINPFNVKPLYKHWDTPQYKDSECSGGGYLSSDKNDKSSIIPRLGFEPRSHDRQDIPDNYITTASACVICYIIRDVKCLGRFIDHLVRRAADRTRTHAAYIVGAFVGVDLVIFQSASD